MVQAELDEERKKVGERGEGEEVEELKAKVEEERKKGKEESNKVSALQAQLAEGQAELDEERKVGKEGRGVGGGGGGARRLRN